MKTSCTVAMVSAELVPFAKVGGLGDVVGALSQTLAELGHRIMVFVPRYREVGAGVAAGFEPVHQVKVPMAGDTIAGRVWRGRRPGSDVLVYLVEQPELFDRDGVYVDPRTGEAFEDNARRFVFFCRAVVETLRGLGLKPDVLHAHDHQAALAVAYLKTIYSEDSQLRGVASLFTIHNLGYQGIYDRQVMDLTGLPPDAFHPMSPFEFWGKFSFMKAGILFADLVSTVSERYAQEIQWSEEFGCGLEGVLRERRSDLIGILNGVDAAAWDPSRDGAIAHHYSFANPAGKELNKSDLIERLGLDQARRERPLLGMVSRLVDQKGIELIEAAAGGLLERDLTLVVLGTGLERYETFLRGMGERAPDRVVVVIGHDEDLARRIFAGADIVLVPSRYEPCGLTQMYALRYGAIPVVRAIGGLADTVPEFEPPDGEGVGFAFTGYNPEEMLQAVDRALAAWSNPTQRARLIQRGMSADHSWRRAAMRYVEAFGRAVERKQQANYGSWASRKVGQR